MAVILRPRSHRNVIVAFHLRSSFWNAKIDCSHGNRTTAYRFFFFSHENAIVPFHSIFFSPCHSPKQQLHPRMSLRKKSNRSDYWTSFAPHCLFTRERNGTISYRSIFRITFLTVPPFGTERCYFKRSHVNATPERSTFRNGTICNGTIAFPRERRLNSSPPCKVLKKVLLYNTHLANLFIIFSKRILKSLKILKNS